MVVLLLCLFTKYIFQQIKFVKIFTLNWFMYFTKRSQMSTGLMDSKSRESVKTISKVVAQKR